MTVTFLKPYMSILFKNQFHPKAFRDRSHAWSAWLPGTHCAAIGHGQIELSPERCEALVDLQVPWAPTRDAAPTGDSLRSLTSLKNQRFAGSQAGTPLTDMLETQILTQCRAARGEGSARSGLGIMKDIARKSVNRKKSFAQPT